MLHFICWTVIQLQTQDLVSVPGGNTDEAESGTLQAAGHRHKGTIIDGLTVSDSSRRWCCYKNSRVLRIRTNAVAPPTDDKTDHNCSKDSTNATTTRVWGVQKVAICVKIGTCRPNSIRTMRWCGCMRYTHDLSLIALMRNKHCHIVTTIWRYTN